MGNIDKYFEVLIYMILALLTLPFFVRVLVFSYRRAVREFRRKYKDE